MSPPFLKIILFLFLFSVLAPLITQAITITSPTTWTTFEDLINAIINFVLYVAIAIFPIMVIISAFFFLSSGGDPAKVKTAKTILLYAVIGLCIVLLAKGIISMLKQLIGAS
jgi:uncharacterized membrane protein